MEIISADKLCCSYQNSKQPALCSLSFSVNESEMVSILGGRGSGKTALAKALNVLLPIESGSLHISGNNANDEKRVWQIRKSCGTVFQNLDSQLISPYVADNVAFSARCFGADEARLDVLTRDALALVGMRGYERRAPQFLPPIYKLYTVLAGVLAAEPDVIVLDNALSALSPLEKSAARDMLKRINKRGTAILLLTDNADDAAIAERVILLHRGEKLADDAPHAVLSDRALMSRAAIAMPFAARVYNDLLDAGIAPDKCPLTPEELAALI